MGKSGQICRSTLHTPDITNSKETRVNSNLTCDAVSWATVEYSKSRVTLADLKNSQYMMLITDLEKRIGTSIPRQLLWHIINNTQEPILCSCGQRRKWVKNLNNYRKTCSPRCAGQESRPKNTSKEKTKKTPWHKNPTRLKEINEKRRRNSLEKYGVDHHRKRPEINEKIRKTNLEKYGSETVFGNSEIRKKAHEAFAKKYLNDADNLKDLVEKRKQTSLARYGVEHPMMSSEIKNKLADTMLSRYGVRHALQNSNFNNKRKETNLERYGNEESVKSPAVKEKILKTVYEKYGEDNWMKSKLSDYARLVLSSEDLFKSELMGITLNQAKDRLNCSLRTILNYATKYSARHIFSDVKITLPETLVENILNELVGQQKFDKNKRNLIYPMELDFFIPEKNLAIEVNGLYWHSEIGGGRDRSYHFTKWRKCLEKNITLLQFSSFEIENKFNLVKSRIQRYLGIPVPIVGARKLILKIIDDYSIEKDFLETWHLQGATSNRNFCIGAYYQGELAALSTWKIVNDSTELVRFATKTDKSYPGLLSRMIKHFISETKFSGEIISYSSNNYGSGKLYSACGFSQVGFTAPGYRYTNNYVDTYSRIEFQKHKLKSIFDLDDEYVNKHSEWEIMQHRGFDRIWDSGNTKWKLEI